MNERMIVKALTIAGSDPSSGAGIQSDLLVFSNLRAYGVSIITSLTAQNTQGIIDIKGLEYSIVRSQLDAVFNDFDINAIKIGMVYSKEVIDLLYDYLKNINIPIVIDPVLRSTTGTILLKEDAYTSFKRLLSLAYVITPNIQEAEILTNTKIKHIEDAKIACKAFKNNIIITGGHFRDKAIDILYTNDNFYEFVNDKIEREFHGAGSIFSAALTAELAKGFDLINACKIANKYTRYALENSYKIGKRLFIPSLTHYIEDYMLELQRAIDILEVLPNFYMLIPETQSNLVYVKDNHILGINGRIVKHGEHVRAGYIDENSSKHVANALSTARRYTDFKAAINIKYDEHIIKIAKELGFTVSSYDRSKEPKEIKEKEGMSIVWGINEAFANLIPDIVYHIGDIGKEAMITIFAKDLNELIDKITKILKYYSADRSQ